jgi:hypothetical protein
VFPRPTRRRWGLGGVTDTALQSAAQALLTHLETDGCSTDVDTTVSAFQTAWNTSDAGTPLVLASGATGADGLYGPNTQTALQSTLNASGLSPVPQAPVACVTAASTSANASQGGGASADPSATIINNAAPTKSDFVWIVVVGMSLAGIGAAYAASRKRR